MPSPAGAGRTRGRGLAIANGVNVRGELALASCAVLHESRDGDTIDSALAGGAVTRMRDFAFHCVYVVCVVGREPLPYALPSLVRAGEGTREGLNDLSGKDPLAAHITPEPCGWVLQLEG